MELHGRPHKILFFQVLIRLTKEINAKLRDLTVTYSYSCQYVGGF